MNRNDKITLYDTPLYELLGAEGIEELRTKLIDMIVEEVHTQFHESSNYLLDPDIVGDVVQDEVEAAVSEVVQEYKEQIQEMVGNKLNNILGGV